MAAGPGELCSPCELCSCKELWQAQEGAALKILMRQKGEARISVNKWLQRVFKVPPASYRAECLACVLGTLPLQALKMLLEVGAFTADFLFFFLSFFSFLFPPPSYFLLLHMDAGRKQGSGESRAARGWGSW